MIKNNKVLFLIVAIEYTFIAMIIFILLGIGNTHAQSLTWNNPTYISLNNGNPGYNIVSQADNSSEVGNPAIQGPTAYYTWSIYQINKNNINNTWQYLDKGTYSLAFTTKIGISNYTNLNLFKVMVFDNGTQYEASCDYGENIKFTPYSENIGGYALTGYIFTYQCEKINVNLDNVEYISIGVRSSTQEIYYQKVINNLYIYDLKDNETDFSGIIASQNKNTQDILNAINSGTLKDSTEVDKEKLEEYEELENELLNKDNLENIKDIKIDVDADALEYVFELLTRIVNTHQLVYGLIITMLSLGVIKLILNR